MKGNKHGNKVASNKVSDFKMQLASCVSVKYKPNNFRVANCDSGNLSVVRYNLTSL